MRANDDRYSLKVGIRTIAMQGRQILRQNHPSVVMWCVANEPMPKTLQVGLEPVAL